MRLLRSYTITLAILCSALNLQAQDSQYKWLHPTPQGNSLQWVKMWDANNWYAAGFQSTFMKTTNGGVNWMFESDIIKVPVGSIAIFYDAEFFNMNTGFACGNFGKIIKTTNGGTNWDTSGYVLQPYYNWKKLHFINEDTGFVAGNTLAFTTNGGTSWSEYSNTIGNLGDVFASDMNNVVVVSASSTNYSYTTNGGSSWNTASMGGAGNCRTMKFINDTTGFVCGSFGNIKMTTNGGHSWTNLVNDTIGSRTLLDLDFVNTGSGTYIYLTAQDTSLFRAPIGTSNWERVSFLQNQLDNDGTVFFSSDFSQSGDTFITVGDYGIINARYSASNKKTFTNFLKIGSIRKVWAESTTGRVITAGDPSGNDLYDEIMYSTNGGTNWQISSYPTDGPHQIFDMQMINSMTGYVSGQQWDISKVIKTTDGGASWTLKTIPPVTDNPSGEIYYYAMDFIDENTGYLFGDNGAAVKTNNGGDNWSTLNTVPISVISSKFVNANTGWVGGNQYPYLLKTTNGGANYTPANIDTVSVLDLFFINSNTGWASCRDGKIRKTTNGGGNWINVDIPIVEDVTSVFFTDPLNGLALGFYGGLYRTRDGGNSWETNKLPANNCNDVYMTATNRAFIVASTGAVLKYEETVTGNGITFTNEVPEGYFLEQNYPNPFNPSTTIRFGLANQSYVSLKVYDISGREVATLLNNEHINAGIVTKNFTASSLSSGVYFYSLVVNGNLIGVKKMIFVK